MSTKLHPVRTKEFRKFLKRIGCRFNRISGDHEIWVREGLERPVTFITNEKEIPPFHLRTNLKTLSLSIEEFLELIASL